MYDHWYILSHLVHHFIPSWYDQCIGAHLQREVINYLQIYNKDIVPSFSSLEFKIDSTKTKTPYKYQRGIYIE